MKKIIYIMFLLIMVNLTTATESLGIFNINEPVNLLQICNNCSYVNISFVMDHESNILLGNVPMTKTEFRYNYTLSNATLTGEYNICGVGDPNGVSSIFCYNMILTDNGNIENKDIFIPLYLSLFGFCVILLYIAFNLDKTHIVIKMFILFVVIFLQYITGNIILRLVENTTYMSVGSTLFFAITWFIRIFTIYIVLYLTYVMLDYLGKIPKIKGWGKK